MKPPLIAFALPASLSSALPARTLGSLAFLPVRRAETCLHFPAGRLHAFFRALPPDKPPEPSWQKKWVSLGRGG